MADSRHQAAQEATERMEREKLKALQLADDAARVFGSAEGHRMAAHLVPPNGLLWGGTKVNTGNSGIYFNAALLEREQEVMDMLGRFCPDAFMAVCRKRLDFLQQTINHQPRRDPNAR